MNQTAPPNSFLVYLNGRSLLKTLWLVARRQDVVLMDAASSNPVLRRLLPRIKHWLLGRAECRDVFDAYPSVAIFRIGRVPTLHDNTFEEIEPWLRHAYRFEAASRVLDDDAMPYKQVTCNYVQSVFENLFILRRVLASAEPNGPAVVGADPLLLDAYEARYGHRPVTDGASGTASGWVSNAAITAFLFVAFAGPALRNVTFRRQAPKPVFLGFDFSDAPYDPAIWRETEAEGKNVLVVHRSQAQKDNALRPVLEFDSVVFGQGSFFLPDALRHLVDAWARLFRLFRFAGGRPSAFFWKLAGISYKRLLTRKLMSSFRFSFFLGRDDYNVEHIIRSQELRRHGGKSIGVSHAVPCIAMIVPMWRYIDFDIYLTFGTALHERYYASTWAPEMKVKAAGTLGFTRERARASKHRSGKDILFAAKPNWNVEALCDCLEALAVAFHDRRILVHTKGSFKSNAAMDVLRAAMRRHPGTVIESDENIYDLILKTRYVVTDPSAVGAEGIQFGSMAFVLDIDGRESLCFRDFPGLCVKTPDDLVARIRDIEENGVAYPWTDYEPLIDQSGITVYDRIREELGLPPLVFEDEQDTVTEAGVRSA